MFFRRVFAKNNGSSATSGEGSSSTSNSSNNASSSSPARYRRVLNVEDNHRVLSVLQLTPLWEYIIRNNELPVGLNMNELFREFLERLHDPEYQVRQHSLRVLIDVLIVLRDESDVYFGPLLPPIIDNLGHPSPAVRKGALDVLKVYIAQTKMPEVVMLEIMNYGMDRNPKDPLSTRYIVGVMLALPSLIQPAILTAKRTFILRAVINALGGKMVQITYQEISLKILLKIKNTIGSREFYECISISYRRDFDLLCNVYGLPNPPKSPRRENVVNLTPPGSEVPMRRSWKPHIPQVPTTEMLPPLQPLSPKAQRWKSGSYNDISRAENHEFDSKSRLKGSDDRLGHSSYAISKLPNHGSSVVRRVSVDNVDKIDDSKVIMETEIKINKESVTMRILEAENSQSISDESDEDNAKRYGVVRVLTDSEFDESSATRTLEASPSGAQEQSSDEYVRRTPRRVRFGGEIVKMRTPDSDTFEQSDQDGLTNSQSSSSSAPINVNNHNSSVTASSSSRSSPIRSALKSSTSSIDRSSSSLRRQFSQSADTERSSPPISSEYINSNGQRPMSAKHSSYPGSESSSRSRHMAFARRRSVTFDEDDMRTSGLSITTFEKSATPTPSPEPPEPPEPPKERSKSTRPKTGRAPQTPSKVPAQSEEVENEPPPGESSTKNETGSQPDTPDNQSQMELPESNHMLAEKIEEVKQAIQGIEEKINNVVLKTVEAVLDHPTSPTKLKKSESAESPATSSPKLQKPNLSLEVLLNTNPEAPDNTEKTDTNDGGKEKELNVEAVKDPPQPSEKANGVSKIPKMIKTGIPKLNTMPSPRRLKPSASGGDTDKSQPASGSVSPQKLLTVGDRSRPRRRTRSATLKRSKYISPSALSPAPHSGIEIMHNLLRSPSTSPSRSRRVSASEDNRKDHPNASDTNNNNLEMTSLDGTKSDKCVNVNEDDIYDVFGKTIATQTSTEELEIPVPSSVVLSASSGPEVAIPSIINTQPSDDSTDVENNNNPPQSPSKASRPSSPKIMQSKIIESWEDLGIVDRVALFQLKSGDWRIRSQGFCAIEESLKSTDNLAKVQPYLESLLRTLLSSERNSDVIDDKVRMLVNLISRLPLENLEDRVAQIMTGLCRQGGPGSNTVAKALMQRLPTAAIVQRLLSDDFLHAKSSKFRENALQMVLFALMTFPSTYFDIKTLISRATEAAVDRKKRVRHGALDVLAVLGQISSPKLVLDVVCTSVAQRPDGNHLIAAVKARLARKQLPFIGPDGSVEYALKVPSCRNTSVIMFGADVDWIEAGSGSASPTSSRSKNYPSFRVDSDSFDEVKRKPSFQVFDEVKQPIESSKVISSGWTSKIPVGQTDSNIATNNGSRSFYGNSQSRSYPEQTEQQQQQQQQQSRKALPKNGANGAKSQTNSNGSNRTAKQPTISRFPEMVEQRQNGRNGLNAKHGNPYETTKPTTRNGRSRLYTRLSDGFMSDTIANANRVLQMDSRPSTDPAIDNGGLRQSRNGMRFYNPNMMVMGNSSSSSKQQGSTHVQKIDIDQRPNLSPTKHYNNGVHNQSSNSNTGGRFFAADTVETPRRSRFLGKATGGGGETPAVTGGINQESYIIHRDEQYDSDNDDKSSNDSSSTRIISNSTFNFGGKGTDPYPPTPNVSHPPSILSSRPHSVTSHKSIGSGILKNDGRLSRTSNISFSSPSIKQSADNVSAKSNRSTKSKENDMWYERDSTPVRSEDVISSNQVQYESDYDDDVEDEPIESRRTATPKRYPTPSPHPLQTSYSTEELSNNSYHQADDAEISPPKSRVQSASMGNLEQLEDETEPVQPTVVPAKKILKKPFLVRKSSKVAPVKEVVSTIKAKNKMNEVIFQKTLRKFDKPKDALSNCLTHLESPNWEQNISGLQFFVRLIRHHPEVIDTQIHLLSVALAKQVRNLRSQVARAACQAAAEFFCTHRRCIEGEAEDIATHLLHRTADTNKFLRADAAQALESMCANLSTPKVIHIISFKGATHQNAVVRTTAAKLLDNIVRQIGSEKVFTLPKESRDKLVLTGAQLLLEGSLDTRNYTKSMFKQLSDQPNYNKVLLDVIPPRTYRNIQKSLNSIKQM
ncbi:uncharacterized protein LOC129777456 [Toxorhynchites rutilus septentrionalis]|uniref:uncharacterized protein LOC129777456 n=1 Tax=Toxorhynchites rutilus septentrionalis TaxID=329112 RepID=UPI00247A9571|nr:uncharacterized protein LOC129777456 [Toxorhynchites rutilus septentrionalis]